MPNIEIHGIGQASTVSEVKMRIREALKGAQYYKDAVVETYPTTVTNLDGAVAPYLRVVCSPDGDLEDVLKRLEPLNMDIEVMPLKQFIPA